MSATTTAGAPMEMSMHPVEELALPAGEQVVLAPGGYHLMLIDLAAALTVGQSFDMILYLESGHSETVVVEVRESAP
jgi:hypothetical protein